MPAYTMPQFDAHIWECARLWILQYGSQARDEALNRAREFEKSGVSGIPWRRVADAIDHLNDPRNSVR